MCALALLMHDSASKQKRALSFQLSAEALRPIHARSSAVEGEPQGHQVGSPAAFGVARGLVGLGQRALQACHLGALSLHLVAQALHGGVQQRFLLLQAILDREQNKVGK